LNATDTSQWRHTSPLAAIFYLGKIYETIAKNAVPSLAPLVAFLVAYQGDLMGKLILGGGAFITFTVVAAILRYWFFRYKIDEGSILIREGVIKKTQADIKFDRIQAINTQQSVIFRVFNLVTVKIDTAGSARQEGNLPAIRTELADSLKERIRRESPGGQDSVVAGDDDAAPTEPAAREILRLGAGDMVKVGLSSNRALIFLAFLTPVIQMASENVEEKIDENVVATAIDAGPVSLSSGIGIVLMIVFGVLLLLAVASVIGAFLRYHNFALVADNDVLRSTGGLLTRHEHSINFAKIQSVYASQNPVLRLFGRLRLSARQASSGRPGADKLFVIPLSEPEQLPLIAGEIFGDEFQDVDLNPRTSEYERISPRYVRSRVILTGILPALAVTGLISLAAGIYALVFLLWIPLDALLVWTIYKKYGYRISNDGMMLRRGFLGFRVVAFTHRKVQRVSVTQTLPQKRKGLATLRIYLASGSIKLPYVDFEMAQQLRDYMLYKAESSQLAWH
jgi:putative membrane protein